MHNSWQGLVNSAWHFWKAFLFFYLLLLCFFGHHFTQINTNLCSCTAVGKKSHKKSIWFPTQSMEKDRVLQGAIQKLGCLLFLSFSSVSKMLLQNQGSLRKINSNGQEPGKKKKFLPKVIERIYILNRYKSGGNLMKRCDLKIRRVWKHREVQGRWIGTSFCFLE